MDASKKLIVGYDLCEDYAQISCFSYKSMEPVPISVREGEDDYLLPTVLCMKNETKQWLFGKDAIACAKNGEGILVEQLLKKAQLSQKVELLGKEYSGVALLEKYLRKTLMLIKNYFPTEPITKLVVTVRNAEPSLVDKIYEALSLLGLEKDRAFVINHAGAYLYYALSQDKVLWMNDVGLFDFTEEGLSYYQMTVNRRVKPMIAGLIKKELTDTLNMNMLKDRLIDPSGANPAYIFENLANTVLYKQTITTLYFTGMGFEGGWADEVIRRLCVGRRVFVGQNLYTKGACYAARELSGDKKLEEYLLLSDDMLSSNVTLRVYCDTAYKELPILQAGDNWYEVDRSIEVIPEGKAELEINTLNIMSRATTREILTIDQFPKRPERMTRLILHITCKDKHTCLITVTDLGFGDFYQGSGQVAEYTIEF